MQSDEAPERPYATPMALSERCRIHAEIDEMLAAIREGRRPTLHGMRLRLIRYLQRGG